MSVPLDAIVLDLDDTLFDTTSLLLPEADVRAVEAMIAAGLGLPRDAALAEVAKLRRAGATRPFLDLSRRHGAGDAVPEAARRAFFVYDVPPLALDPAVAVALDELAALAPLALLTSGWEDTQRQKVARLGIAERFVECVYTPWNAPGGKTVGLRGLLARRAWRPDAVVMVGDRPDSDIRAGRETGCLTVLVRRAGAEFAAYEPSDPLETPWRTIGSITHLPALLAR